MTHKIITLFPKNHDFLKNCYIFNKWNKEIFHMLQNITFYDDDDDDDDG